uniref:Uncharacterized protein n=1 Tax=Zea mays TaxID=4577 RepID=C4J514_MAIZE|nr:unknown [Zea mays]
MPTDETLLELEPRRACEPERGVEARVRHRDDDVGARGRGLLGQRLSEGGTALVNGVREHHRVGQREVDVLEHAGAPGAVREEAGRGDRHVAAVDHDHLPGLHLALVGGVDEVQRAGLRREDDSAVPAAAHHQRAEPMWVAHGEELVGREEQERVGPREALAGVADPGEQGPRQRRRDEVEDDLRVRGRVEDGPPGLELVP